MSGTYMSVERDTYPTFASVKVPMCERDGAMVYLLVPAFKYSDGSVSRVMMTNPEWAKLKPEQREKLTEPPDTVNPEFA